MCADTLHAEAKRLVSANKAACEQLYGGRVGMRDDALHRELGALHAGLHTSPYNATQTVNRASKKDLARVDTGSAGNEEQAGEEGEAKNGTVALYKNREEEEEEGRKMGWGVYRVISGHTGWTRCVSFDASNRFFATGSSDRTIKVWDSGSGRLRVTLTGHISGVRRVQMGVKQMYMYSVGEDKTVKCWDMERNTVIRNYHGHLSGVYALGLLEHVGCVVTGGRDSSVRVWDVRTRGCVYVWGGHRDCVNDVETFVTEPQIVSASSDGCVRMWDMTAGRCRAVLTRHKRGVRGLCKSLTGGMFLSAGGDRVRKWGVDGAYVGCMEGEGIVNAVCVNEDGVVVGAGDDGRVRFWTWDSGALERCVEVCVQPGSLACENGVLGCAFDRSGGRVVTVGVDKSIRMWREREGE